jgi:hypothetical protein
MPRVLMIFSVWQQITSTRDMIPPSDITANIIHKALIRRNMHLLNFSVGKEGGIERGN